MSVADDARRPPRVSLRARLVAIVVLAIVGMTLVFGVLVFVTARSVFVQRIDDQLQATNALAQQTYATLAQPGNTARIPSEYVVMVHREDSRQVLVLKTDFAPEGQPAIGAIGFDEATQLGGQPFTAGPAEGDQSWRVVAWPLRDRDLGNLGSVSVALPIDANAAAIDLAGRTVLVGLAAAALVGILGAWAVDRSMRPLRDVEATAAAIAAGDFSRRMPEGQQDTEVGRLTAALNGMLTQIESAIRSREASRDHMRRFVADASHELRTPLAAIRGYAELHRQGAVHQTEVPQTFSRVEREATRLGDLVDDLLVLARLDEQRPMAREPVELAVLAVDTAASVRALDPQRTVTIGGPWGSPLPQVVVTGDDHRLRQVLANLAGNAVRHTPPGSPVEIVLWPSDGGWTAVDVVDHGVGIADDDKRRVFERFTRLDASRTRSNGGGAGLGLSIVASVVAGHDGTVEVLDTPGGGATFRVLLPAGGGADEPPGSSDEQLASGEVAVDV